MKRAKLRRPVWLSLPVDFMGVRHIIRQRVRLSRCAR